MGAPAESLSALCNGLNTQPVHTAQAGSTILIITEASWFIISMLNIIMFCSLVDSYQYRGKHLNIIVKLSQIFIKMTRK